jgi:hypothetical protein
MNTADRITTETLLCVCVSRHALENQLRDTKTDVGRPRRPSEMEQNICGLSEDDNGDLQFWKPILTVPDLCK